MKEIKLFAIFLTFYLVNLPNAFAHYYVGGYFSVSASTTSKVIFATNFPNTNPGVIPSNGYLMSVISAAGGQATTPTAWTHQSPVALLPDGSVHFVPQAWWRTDIYFYMDVTVGTVNSVMFYCEIRVQPGGNVFFKAFVYNTQDQWNKNNPTIYTYSYNTGVSNLLYGKAMSPYGILCKFLQCGVEAPVLINSPNWRVYQKDFSYYGSDLKWHYVAAKSVEGNNAWITWDSVDIYGIGGQVFTGVNVEIPSADIMKWKWNGITIGDDVSLWTTSGIVYPYPTGA